MIRFSILLLAAGNETTTNLIANAVRRLTEEETLQARLLERPDGTPTFVEEVLRFYPPVQAIGRTAVRDVEVGGKTVRAGELVVAWVASANRDETRFADPDTFVPDRSDNPHLAFGFGPHFCLGAPLARLEGQIAIRAVVERMKRIRRAPGTELQPIPSPFVFGVKALPVEFDR